MKYLRKLLGLLVIYGASFAVHAGCEHEGVTYDEGATICSGGWLMQCTSAGYWSTIGACRQEDRKNLSSPSVESLGLGTEVARMSALTETQGMTGNSFLLVK
ncbi:MAG: hypothetical protein J5I92_11380 [Thiogranum sp.]|nr:hypothetical protein [Thiogranum sp.]